MIVEEARPDRDTKATWLARRGRLRSNFRTSFGASVLLSLIVIALAAPWLAPHDPFAIDPAGRLQGMSSEHWMGTDDLGRDILSRLIYGSRTTFLVSIPSVVLAMFLGVPFGLFAGYYRGVTEQVLMRLTEVLLAFPPIILGIFVVAFLGASIANVVIVIGLLYAPTFARITYGTTLSKSEEAFVEAARAIGASSLRITLRTVLPNITAPILIQMSITLGTAILLESSLSFLGLGPPPPDPSWGRMVGNARPFMIFQPWFVVWPSVAIALAIIAANLLGDGLRDLWDPRARTMGGNAG